MNLTTLLTTSKKFTPLQWTHACNKTNIIVQSILAKID